MSSPTSAASPSNRRASPVEPGRRIAVGPVFLAVLGVIVLGATIVFVSVDHTSSIMIIDARGRVLGAFPPPQRPERMLEQFGALRRHLRI